MQQQQFNYTPDRRYPYGDMRNVQRSQKRAGDWYYDASGKARQMEPEEIGTKQ